MGSTYQEAGQNTPRHALAANPADPREMSAGSQTSKVELEGAASFCCACVCHQTWVISGPVISSL